MLEMNKMGAGRHLEFDKLVPPAHAYTSGSLFRTPWATPVPYFSSSLTKKELSFLESFCNLAGNEYGHYKTNLAAVCMPVL